MSELRIRAADLEGVRAHARGGAPLEVCGLLAGRREGDRLDVERVVRVPNADPDPRVRYALEPAAYARAVLQAEDEWGLEVVGFYHSHPAGPPRLSATDHARASWPDAAYLLVWLAPDEGVGCWTWREKERAFEARAIVVR
ncbi:MAG TPA: M67 family metallopeptidase [Candidatus Thermoplasmatota archaeon]|nr:M67 family metallopeptidase [Candidatus Thermoplasmatota archaeon]